MKRDIRVGDVWEYYGSSQWEIIRVTNKIVGLVEINGYSRNFEYKRSNFRRNIWQLVSRTKEASFDTLYERMMTSSLDKSKII